jgi:ligand-binding sensor domain-containing protein
VYATAHFDRIWKSHDRGKKFGASAVGISDDTVLSLALSPADHQVLWAGTATHGVFKSSNAGDSWTAAARGLPPGGIVAVVADPQDAATAYAEIAQAGVFRTADGGASWQPLGQRQPVESLNGNLAIAAFGPRRVLYAGTTGAGLFALAIP